MLEVASVKQELAAMSAVHGALEPLDPSARSRVLTWTRDRYDLGADLHQTIMGWLLKLIDAVADHAEQNENPTDAERKLYEVLEGTRHATKIRN